MNILQIHSSIRGIDSASSTLATEIVGRLTAAHPNAVVQHLDLATHPMPVLDGQLLGALFTPADQRSPTQQILAAATDQAIAQVQQADAIVIGVPMYNFAVPVQLKGWFDAVARAGVTFRYTANGPEGLLTSKRVYLALTRGGLYPEDQDPQLPWLLRMLAFIGLTDVQQVKAGGQAMGPEAAAAGMASAREQVRALQV